MANVTLGDISFGLGADTTRLFKSLNMMKQFGREVNKMARSQVQGAQTTAAAMARQERAIREALQQLINFQTTVQRSNLTVQQQAQVLSASTIAFKSYTTQMTRGRISTVQFTRSQDVFRARMNKQKRSFDALRLDQQTKKYGRFANTLRDLESASVLAVGPLSGLGARIRAIGAISGRSTLLVAGFLAAIAGGIFGIFKLTQAAINFRKEMDKIQAQLRVGLAVPALAGETFTRLTDLALKLGVGLTDTASGFSKFAAATKGTNLEGRETFRIFKAITTAGVALKLTNEDLTGVFRALQQMVSKGTVQAEELRGQFGERMPGGFRAAADAMGITTKALGKLLEAGEVTAEILLPLLADLYENKLTKASEKASQSLQSANARVSIAFTILIKKFDEVVDISETYKKTLELISRAMIFVAANGQVVAGAFGAIAGAMAGFLVPSLFVGLEAVAVGIVSITKSIVGLRAAITALQLVAFGAGLLRLVAIIGGAIIGYQLLSRAIGKTVEVQDEFIKQVNDFLFAEEQLRASSEQTAKTLITEAKARLEVVKVQIAAQKIFVEQLKTQQEMRGFFGDFIRLLLMITRTAQDSFVALKELTRLEQLFGELTVGIEALQKELDKIDSTAVKEMSSDFKTAKEKILDLGDELVFLKIKMQALGEGNIGRLALTDDIAKARKIFKSLSDAERKALDDLLIKMKRSGSDLQARLAGLIGEIREMEDAVKLGVKQFEEIPLAVRAARVEINRLNARTEAMFKGPEALKAFDAMVDRIDNLEAFKQTLIDAGVEMDKVVILAEKFNAALLRSEEGKRQLEEIANIVKSVERAFDKAFDRIGKSITEAFLKGETAALEFGNIVNAVLSEIIQTMLNFTLFDPLKQGLSSILSGLFAPGAPTGSKPAPASKGMAFANGIRMLGKGGLLEGPTLFNTRSGPAIGGEAGTEGVFPLVRSSGGDLGVKGAPPIININIFNNVSGASVQTEETPTADGGFDLSIFIDDINEGLLKRNSKTTQAISDMFGQTPVTTGR